ncbi:hypothetical protein FPZ42_08515 [Mucilaginibacter achroorhodeus]|uniref:Lipoprotein n=1 Tax=Mucilaginibacter achroorhodeus TaxID=2599294 RepID=A0A563U6V1_9SPHI|nr:hypothetical protein [Mucilaginibacter achroorhodeus]TWR27065.1 hypothetical protein FPZ42_08515 [Mucilaginibacter achroorhodeus]
MKIFLRTGLLATAIAISFAACKGNNSTHVPDSTRTDDTAAVGKTVGRNGSGSGIDSSADNSGSGGTDTVKATDTTKKKM